MKFFNLNWNQITQAIIIWIGIALIGLSATFFIQTKIDSEVNKEKEKIQTEQIITNKEKDIEVINKIDSNYIRNIKEHKELLFAIQDVKEEVTILSYVISKSNQQLKWEIEELKNLRINQNDDDNYANNYFEDKKTFISNQKTL